MEAVVNNNSITKNVSIITSKIIDLTGNKDTKQFVGKPLCKRNTKRGIVYIIGDTGYSLSAVEYDMFCKKGAIAKKQVRIPEKQKQDINSVIDVSETSHEVSNDITSIIDDSDDFIDEHISEERKEEIRQHRKYMETSKFLADYPAPEFVIKNSRWKIFDILEDMYCSISAKVDAFGQNSRDKIIDSMNVDGNTEEFEISNDTEDK